MKKILSFLLAGVAALGLIGCSGDLHDSVVDTVYIIGSATTAQWETANALPLTKTSDTTFTITTTLTAGEYKFIQFKSWDVQWGSNGKGTNQDSWKNTDPGEYTITYDVALERLTATSLSTALDDPMKVGTTPWLHGGIGSVKLTKNGTLYTGTYTCAADGKGTWGEDEGYVRCALIACPADTAGTAPDLGDGWKNVVTRYGSGKEDPQNEKDMSTGGYAGLKDGYYCPVGTAYSGLTSGGNFVIKGVEAGKTYDITVDMSSGSPVITVAEQK